MWTPPVGIRSNITRKEPAIDGDIEGSRTVALQLLADVDGHSELREASFFRFQFPILVFTGFNACHGTPESGNHQGLDY